MPNEFDNTPRIFTEEEDSSTSIYYQGSFPKKNINYPITSSLDIRYITHTIPEYSENRKYIHALVNTLERNVQKSPHYSVSSSQWNKLTQDITLVSVPSIMYGSSLKRGSVELSIVFSGSLVAKVQDIKLNGELIQIYPTSSDNYNSVAGVVLYEQGFILLTGSWDNIPPFEETEETLKWKDWSLNNANAPDSLREYCAFDLNFNGVNEINTLTMLAHAPKGELNYSNNPTFIEYGEKEKYKVITGSNMYIEPDNIKIKNINKYEYDNYTGSLEKQVYISKIGIYDEKQNLIGIAKLAKPVRKTEGRDFTFKLKLDI